MKIITQKILALILLFSGFTLTAQSVDSVRAVALAPDQAERERTQAIDILGDSFLGGPADSVLKYATLYQELAKQTDAQDLGMARLLLAVYYTQIGDTAKVRSSVRRGVDLCFEAGASEKAIIRIRDVARYLLVTDQYPLARSYFKYGAMLADSVDNLRWQGIHTANAGLSYEREGYMEEAMTYYEKSLAMFEVTRDSTLLAWTLDGLGRANHFTERRVDTALSYYQRSFDIWFALGNQFACSGNLINMAGIYLGQGNYAESLDLYQRALRIVEEVQEPLALKLEFKASILNDIGEIYTRQDMREKALSYYEESLALARELGSKRVIAKELAAITNSYQALGKDSLALRTVNEALDLVREIGARSIEGELLGILGRIKASRGAHSAAEVTYLESLTIREELADKWGQVEVLNGLTSLNLTLGNYAAAERYGQRGLAMAEEIKSIPQVANMANLLWQSQKALGQP
ncbi:MAG: tetratricopeptide repeat protein, partial [Bacteroidota bacterium]